MNKVLGIALVVMALAIGIMPHYTDCLSQGKAIALPNGSSVPMKCHWSAQAEIATAIPLGLVGLAMIATRRKEYLRVLGGAGAVLGVSAILIPTSLIGVCSSAMPCHTLMQPSLVALGSVAAVGSLGAVILARK